MSQSVQVRGDKTTTETSDFPVAPLPKQPRSTTMPITPIAGVFLGPTMVSATQKPSDAQPSTVNAPRNQPGTHRFRRESIVIGICLAIGLIILPALIYAFGVNVLGAYGGGPHIGSFYGDYFRNLASGTFRTWLLVLTPYLLVWALRFIFRAPVLPSMQPGPPSEPRAASAEPPAPSGRREPFISS